jgi:Meiotically up-regulated gene 113
MAIRDCRKNFQDKTVTGKVYLIECDINGEITYKIGHTFRSPELRIQEMSTGNPGSLRVVSVFETEYATVVESVLHKAFDANNIRGEWFTADITAEAFISEAKKAEASIRLLYYADNPFMKKRLKKHI